MSFTRQLRKNRLAKNAARIVMQNKKLERKLTAAHGMNPVGVIVLMALCYLAGYLIGAQ